jgi:HSP20 family protein
MVTFAPTMKWAARDFNTGLMDDLNQFFDGFETERAERASVYTPPVEITESDEYYSLSLEVPGMKNEDLKIELDANVLTVSGERKRESNPQKGERIQLVERNYGFFKRSFTLPNTIDAEKVEAAYENGVLQIVLPKMQAARPRKIEIQSEKSGGILSQFLGGKKETQDKAELA